MQIAARLLTVLCAGIWCQQAWAEDPPAPSPPATVAAAEQSPAAPASALTAQQSAASSTSESATIKPPVTVIGTKPELTPQDKELISRGYKLEMRHGEKYFCRREQQMGSRFEVKNCDTAESIEAHRQSSQEAMRVIQSDRSKVSN